MYRFYRPRRPGGIGNGLPLEGVSSKFGLAATIVLLLIGVVIFFNKERITAKDVQATGVRLTASPYAGKKAGTYLVPLEQSRVLLIDQNAAKAVDTTRLFALQKGDSLLAFVKWETALAWQNGKSPKGNAQLYWLKNLKDGQWVIAMGAYKKAESNNGNAGLWLLIFSLILLPYQIWRKIPVPLWLALIVYAVTLAIFVWW